MTQKDLEFFKHWFSDYTKTFHTGDQEDRKNIFLKELHTSNVCRNIQLLVRSSEIKELQPSAQNPNFEMIAETIALFHDIGRFQQYAEYKTFQDSISVNHAVLGARILSGKKVLRNLPEREEELILQSVKFHNAFTLPDIQDSDSLLLLKLIRDADKLDIWRVFLEHYESPIDERASAAGLGLSDLPGYSEEVLLCIFGRRIAALSSLKTLNDFKLLQLSWIYDLNFKTSLNLLLERNYIEKIVRTLPQTDEIQKVPLFLQEYIDQRLKDSSYV